MGKPEKLDIVWAESGIKIDPGDVKFDLGWEAEIPPYQHFNYILNKHSAALSQLNSQGILEWDALTSYITGARVLYSGIMYKCVQAGSLGNAPSVSLDWYNVDTVLESLDSRVKLSPVISGSMVSGTVIFQALSPIIANIGEVVALTGGLDPNNSNYGLLILSHATRTSSTVISVSGLDTLTTVPVTLDLKLSPAADLRGTSIAIGNIIVEGT